MATQVGSSQPQHSKGFTIDWAIIIWHAYRPHPSAWRPTKDFSSFLGIFAVFFLLIIIFWLQILNRWMDFSLKTNASYIRLACEISSHCPCLYPHHSDVDPLHYPNTIFVEPNFVRNTKSISIMNGPHLKPYFYYRRTSPDNKFILKGLIHNRNKQCFKAL